MDSKSYGWRFSNASNEITYTYKTSGEGEYAAMASYGSLFESDTFTYTVLPEEERPYANVMVEFQSESDTYGYDLQALALLKNSDGEWITRTGHGKSWEPQTLKLPVGDVYTVAAVCSESGEFDGEYGTRVVYTHLTVDLSDTAAGSDLNVYLTPTDAWVTTQLSLNDETSSDTALSEISFYPFGEVPAAPLTLSINGSVNGIVTDRSGMETVRFGLYDQSEWNENMLTYFVAKDFDPTAAATIETGLPPVLSVTADSDSFETGTPIVLGYDLRDRAGNAVSDVLFTNPYGKDMDEEMGGMEISVYDPPVRSILLLNAADGSVIEELKTASPPS